MYPRVKVRMEEEPKAVQKDDASCIVRVIGSLSIESQPSRILVSNHASRTKNRSNPPYARISKSYPKDLVSPAITASRAKEESCRSTVDGKTKNSEFSKDNKCQNDSHLPDARTSESQAKTSLTPSTVPSKGKKNDGFEEDNKINIRASPIPRPRAVLSSPDNDGIIGSQNQLIQEKRTPLNRLTSKTNGIDGQKDSLLRERRTLNKRQTMSLKREAQTKLCCSRLNPPQCEVKSSGSGRVTRGKRLSELSDLRQRPPFKVG